MRFGLAPVALAVALAVAAGAGASEPPWVLWTGVNRAGHGERWRILEILRDRMACEQSLTAALGAQANGFREAGLTDLVPVGDTEFFRVDEGSLEVFTFRFACRPETPSPAAPPASP